MGTEHGAGRGEAARLLEEHGATVARVCMALLGDAREVERVLEQVARELGARPRSEGTSERAFVFGIARTACATQMSKVPLRAVTQATGPVTERLGAKAATPARDLLAKLKPSERDAVVLHTIGGLDVADVAAACGIDVDAARTRIAHAMSKLVEGGAR